MAKVSAESPGRKNHRKSRGWFGNSVISGKSGVFLSIGAIIPVFICAYIIIRFVWPGATELESLIAVIFIILSLSFVAAVLVREVIVNIRLIGETRSYPKGILLPELARRLKLEAAGLEKAADAWHETYRELLDSKGYIENIVNAIGESLIAVNLDGTIEWVNRETENLLGYRADEIALMRFAELLPEEERAELNGDGKIRELRLSEFETSLAGKGGKKVPVSLTTACLADDDGDAIGVIAVAADLREKKALVNELQRAKDELERKVAERTADLAESRDFQENIIRSMTDMLVVSDEASRISKVNEACEELLGYSADELEGKSVDEILLSYPEDCEDEGVLLSKNGEKVPASVKISDISDKSGKLIGRLIIARDMRERLASETRMREASRMVSLGQFAAGAAHEINNPLSVISSNAQLLVERLWELDRGATELKGQETKEMIQSLDLIRRYALSCSTSIRGLLDFARGASEIPQKGIVDVNKIISDTISFLEPQFNLSGLSIKSSLGGGDFKIEGDYSKLQQVFMNILLNSREATPRGGTVSLSTEKVAGRGPGGAMRVEISDEGRGIPPENLGRVFDPFFTTKKPGTGTGLGLSVVYSAIKEHGGVAEVASDGRKGTKVVMTLPLADG